MVEEIIAQRGIFVSYRVSPCFQQPLGDQFFVLEPTSRYPICPPAAGLLRIREQVLARGKGPIVLNGRRGAQICILAVPPVRPTLREPIDDSVVEIDYHYAAAMLNHDVSGGQVSVQDFGVPPDFDRSLEGVFENAETEFLVW
jgi:hypothetical protein